jgi:hypothetical protein
LRYFGFVCAVLAAILPAPLAAQTRSVAPVNLAPDSQWEMMSGWATGTQENVQGTGPVADIAASANTTGTIGRATFTVSTTDALSVGDLVATTGTPADPCFAISPMRIVALAANGSITVRTPQGCTPSRSGATTLRPVTAGTNAVTATGSGPDGWLKTPSLPMWRNENRGAYAANMPTDTGAYAALGMTKDRAAAEHLYIAVPPQNLARFAGRTVVLGIYGYQKIRNGSGTWSIWTNDSVNGVRTPCAAAAAAPGYQWLECSFAVPVATTYLMLGVQLNGAASDTYYFVNPVLAIGTAIGGVGYYQKPQGEILIPQVHISPYGWINASITFPAVAAPFCGSQVTCFEHDLYAETGGTIAPTVAKCHGQMEGIDAGAVVTGGGYVRLMAWFDRGAAPEKSGSFLAQYVSNVKSFAYMDFALDQTDPTPDLLGTGIYASNVPSDQWGNVSEEIDWCILG